MRQRAGNQTTALTGTFQSLFHCWEACFVGSPASALPCHPALPLPCSVLPVPAVGTVTVFVQPLVQWTLRCAGVYRRNRDIKNCQNIIYVDC